MKRILLLAGLSALVAPCAQAQVAVNAAALQQLAGAPPPAPKPTPTAAAPVPHVVHHHHAAPAVVAAKPAPPPLPQAAPALPQAAPATLKAAPPPPSVPTEVLKALAPVRINFAPGSADLPASAANALRPFCHEGGMVSIDAHAPANPSDPSAAMRLSLSRALAVKAVLAACGVPVQNIVPRAAGATPGHADDQTIVAAGTGAGK
ncbi:MAG: OmpA family protein [Acidocella sp.]|nr:OmpA family protein [Acidocella sp.]